MYKTIVNCVIVLAGCLILLISFHAYKNGTINTADLLHFLSRLPRLQTDRRTHWNQHYFTIAKIIEQRNNLSRDLNVRQQKIGQMDCRDREAENATTKVSDTGGWCEERSVEAGHMTDKQLVPALAKFFTGKYVGSFGDGPGRYKQLLLDTGLLKGYDAYDGAPFSEKTSEGRVQYLDLTLPQYGLPLYDWVMSLEVAEHIPREYEHVFLDNIVRHAKEGVVLSWATPGQNGFQHVNNRPFKYVKNAMRELGFVYDLQNSKLLQDAAKFDWFKSNTNVFRRNNTDDVILHEQQTFWT